MAVMTRVVFQMRVDNEFLEVLDKKRGNISRTDYVKGLVVGDGNTKSPVMTESDSVMTKKSVPSISVMTSDEERTKTVLEFKKVWHISGEGYRKQLVAKAEKAGYKVDVYKNTLLEGDNVVGTF